MSRDQKPVTYIYDLPGKHRLELRYILDDNGKWEDLAGMQMNLHQRDISFIRNQRSPTEALLDIWGQRNHTVQELFVLLSRMEHYRAMNVIKEFIDEKYHYLIHEGENQISRLLSQMNKTSTPKAMNSAVASDTVEASSNIERDLNIRQNYENFSRKQEDKKLNLVLPKSANAESNLQGASNARAVSPGKGGSGDLDKPHSRESNNITEDIKRTISEIPFHELKKATNNWNVANILGKGGFGTVYVGEWKETKVAVKVFKKRPENETGQKQNQAQMSQLVREMQILDSIRHDNIVSVYGFSFGEGLEPCIVYQLMENGSLEDRLLCKKDSLPLSWLQRFEIARGTARGLQFLHTKGERPLIHGDIKSANILLDANMKPYIGDFGLVTEGPIPTLTHMTVMNVNGTKPYLPFDYLSSRQISTKVDTYSFGIVMFEICTGQRAYCRTRKPEALRDLVSQQKPEDLIDRRFPMIDSLSREIFNMLLSVGKRCSAENAKQRPEVVEVLKELEKMNIPCRAASVASYTSIPLELQRAYDSRNRQRTISGDSSVLGARPMMTSRQGYPSPSIQEFLNSTPSTLPTTNPFPMPSPSPNYRYSPTTFNDGYHLQGATLLMVQQPHYLPLTMLNSTVLNDQRQLPQFSPNQLSHPPEPIQEHTESSGSKFLPTVLPGSSTRDTDSQDLSTPNVPLLTKLGVKSTEKDSRKVDNNELSTENENADQ